MKAILYSLLLLFVPAFRIQAATIIWDSTIGVETITQEPLVTLIQATAVRINGNSATFTITFGIEAPTSSDIYLDKTQTRVNLNLYFDPGEGNRWVLADAPGSPTRPATLMNSSLVQESGSISGDTSTMWMVPAGQFETFQLTVQISLNAFEDPKPSRFIRTDMTHLNWGTDPTVDAPYFTAIDGFWTPYVNLGPIVPEPTVPVLLAMTGCLIVGMRPKQSKIKK